MSRPAPEDLEDACRLTSPERLRPTKRLKTTATTTTMMIHSTEDADVITKMEVDSVAPASASSTMSPPIGDPNKEDMGAEPKIITTSSLNNFSSSTSSTSPSSSSSSRDESTFQKVNKLQKYVPYAAHLTKTREELWSNLQANLLSAIAAQGQPLLEWLHACEQYLSAFGFAFSKADHLMLVHLCWRALFTIEHDYTVMRQLTKLLTRLLRETKLLSRADLQLDWRPLHALQELTSYSAAARKQTVLFEPEFSTEIRELTAYSRPYFSAASTSEMLTQWRPLLCPYSNQYRKYIAYLRSFLPTMLPPEEHHQGFKLWFDDFMTLWTALPNQELDEYGCYAHLFAMLARDALGYIDWEPHLPLLFERLKKSFNGLMMLSTELTLSAQWIVYMIYPGSGCLASLKQLFAFRLVDGRNMLNAIMEEFIGRIREERGGGSGGEKKKKHWYDYVPESHKLTDQIIADFSAFIWEQYLLSSATTVSSAADFDVEYLYRLSLFCAEQLPKEVVSRLSLAHERFFEPARLQPALQLFSVSLYHLITNEKVGERYRPEVVPIMRRLIGSLNTNDHSLCYLHLFAIRSVVILGLPIEDLSGLADSKKGQLTSAQRKALKSTAQLEAFASDFLRLCFTIVESNNEDLFGVSKKGLGMKTILYDIFTGLLANVRPAAFRSLVDTLYRYVRGRTVEGANSCFILHKLILATVVMDRGDSYALPKFFNGITASLLEVIEEKEKFSEVCRSEFVYHLTLFTGCFKDGRAMLKYRPALVDLFRRLLALDFQENSQHITLVTNAIGCLFNVVTSIYPSEPAYGARKRFGGSKDQEEEEEEDEGEKLKRFLTGWPYEVSLKAIDNRWYVPGPEETDFARALFREFIRPQMDLLRSWVDGTTSAPEVNKAALEKALGIILSFSGFRDCLPKFDDPEAAAAERYFTTAEDVFALDLFDGKEEGDKSPLPFRDDLVQLMGRVLRRLKDCPGDNVSSLRLIIKILDFAMFPADAVNAASPADFSLVDEYAASGDDGALAAAMDLQSGGGGGGSSKNLCVFSSIYRTLEGKKKTAYIPLVQYSRLGDYHLRMLSLLKSWPNAQLTAPHRATIEQLFELATGSSADVRADAQAILFDVMESYPQSYPLITAKLAAYLGRQQPSEHYDAFKGTLHLLLGTATKSLLLSESWTALNALWPALLQANWCVEKPKIVDMLDNDLLPLLFGYFYTVPVERKVAILGGGFEKELLSQAEQRGFRAPSQEEVAKVEAAIDEENGKNVALYGELVGRLVEILEEHKLHWRFYNLGLSLLSFLIRYDRPFPEEAAALFLENLVHDSFKIRLTATSALRKILFLRKKEQLTKDSSTTTITVQDVDFDSLPLDPLATGGVEAYERTVFYDKAHIGYYPGCTYQMVVKAGRARKTPENEEDFIFTKFSDEAFLGKLFALFAIEREKDEQMSELMETLEKVQDMVPMDNAGLSMISAVDENFVKLWQYLASMYGLFNHQRLLFPRLEALLEEGRPHSDKVVVEVLVGLVKAAPALSGAEMASLNDFLRRRLFDRHLERFHGESKNSWSYLFSSFFANRDRRRFGWVVEYLLQGDNQLLEEGSTMTMSGQSAYLAFLSTVLADNWQWPAVGEAVLAKLERHLDHPYQTVRLAIASLLSKSVFYPRIGVAMNVNSSNTDDMRPSLGAFIGRTVERLDRSLGPLLVTAKDEDKKEEEGDENDGDKEEGGGGGGMAAVKSALFDKDSAEGVRLHNYIETVAQWVFGGLINRYLVNSSDFLPFLPYMCVIHTPNKPVQALVNKVVSTLSVMPYPNAEQPAIQATVGRLSTNWNWHSRHEMTIFLNNFFFSSIYQLRAAEPELGTLSSLQLILLSLLADEKIEVRESARRTLTNIIAWEVMDGPAKQSLLDRFIASYREKTELREKHAAALGVCAFVYANKRQMTAFLANVVIYLCRLLTDPLPAVQKSVSETLKAFMKGHSDNWVEHKKMFTAEQLAELADISIFSSYIS